MRTEGALQAIVFEPRGDALPASQPSWHAARTSRSLARLGIDHVLVRGHDPLIAALENANAPTWLLRAGAVPFGVPRVPGPSATGRWLIAYGATHGDEAWTAVLAATGGDLAGVSHVLPPARSVFIERPRALVDQLAAGATHNHTTAHDAISGACARCTAARAVRLPGFDVRFSEAPHILELVTTLHRGGAERVVLDLAREMTTLGVDVTLAVLDRASRTTFEAPPVTVFLDEHGSSRVARLQALGDLAIASGVDILHAHLLNGDDLRLLARAGVSVVTTIHNSQPGWPIELDALSPGDVALAIACSLDVERQLEKACFPAAIRTIWNGIARATASAAARGTAASSLRLLSVANHRPQKRLERLPAIVAALRQRGRDARVLIVGEPVRGDPAMVAIDGDIRQEAARLGVADAVELRASCSDVASLYAACDVVVSTSAFEGLSLVHLETLAAGRPLVTTAVSGTNELIRKHSHAHAVAIGATAEQFADAIEYAVGAPIAPSLSLDFTAPKMAERHVDLFTRVLATPRRRVKRRGIVLIANNFSTGGAQSSARRLLLTLASAGVPVCAIVLQEQSSFPTPGRSALTAAGIEVIVAPRAGDVDPLVTARAIARSVDEIAPEALLFWNVISQHKVLVADLLLDTPIWDVSPGEMYYASFDRYLVKPRVASPYLTMRDYGCRLEGVIVKYEAERARAESALGVRVEVVPNGVSVPSSPTARRPASLGERVVVGTLARLGVDKKLEQLVDAVAHAAAHGLFESCELRIAGGVETGDRAYVDALRERSRELPIVWVGEQDSATFLADLDLFAMVSEPSGCPNASIEAMAAGLAVVATDVGGVREQVVDGETGLLVARGDSAALGEAIASLARDPVRRVAMGRAAHARALARFDVRRMASDYARICLG